jgi:hypothetical protein
VRIGWRGNKGGDVDTKAAKDTKRATKSVCGRPTDYSIDVAVKLCELVASGEKLVDICKPADMPARSTVYLWFAKYPTFMDMYTRAREERGDLYADEIVDIADTESDPNKARVRIDARKWAAAKLNQKSYGDKVTVDGNLTMKLTDDQLDARLAQLLGKTGTVAAIGREGDEAEPA